MARLSDNQIDAHLDKLLNFVDGLPMVNYGKEYIKAKVLWDYFHTWQFDDEANSFTIDEYLAKPFIPRHIEVRATYGIENTSQIKRWTESFKNALRRSRGMDLEQHLKELDKQYQALQVGMYSNNLTTYQELCCKRGLKFIREPKWDNQLEEILGAEITFSNEHHKLLTTLPYFLQQQDISEENCIVKKLETRLADRAASLYSFLMGQGKNKEWSQDFIESLISGFLLKEFSKNINERIRPLNNQLINNYLSSYLEQFKTHTPPRRHATFIKKYLGERNISRELVPSSCKHTIKPLDSELDVPYCNYVWRIYNEHFHSFKKVVENLYDEFSVGLIGTPEPPPLLNKKKPSVLCFQYKNILWGSSNLAALMKSLISAQLIHKDTAIGMFKRIFNCKENELNDRKVEQKIIWTGNISELAHFIKTLHNTAQKVEDTKQQIWAITINCFEMENGTVLTKERLRGQKNKEVARAKIIEDAVNIL